MTTSTECTEEHAGGPADIEIRSTIERDRAVRRELSAGKAPADVAVLLGVPVDVVDRIAVITETGQAGSPGGVPVYQPDASYKPCPDVATVLEQIEWRIADHVRSPVRCTRRDAALCDSIILEDLTLEEAGDRADVTRERMRQILIKHTGLTTRDLSAYRGRLREARRLVSGKSVVLTASAQRPDASLNELAALSGLTVDEVAELLGHDETLRRRARNTWTVGMSDEDVLVEIRRVAALPGGTPLTGPFYDAHRSPQALGSVRVIQRFGTWRQACQEAGVAMRERVRDYDRRWSEAQLLAWVADYVQQAGATRATYAGFESWLRERRDEGAPSGQTVRNYLGKWGDILEMLAERD